MNIDELKEMWAEESVIVQTDLTRESLRSPHLHSKYLDILINAKMRAAAYRHDLARLHLLKSRYWKGELTKEELAEQGWPQYQYNKPLKSEVDGMLDADAECIKIKTKIEYLELMIFQLDSIMNAIKSRGWDIRNAIDFLKYQSGL